MIKASLIYCGVIVLLALIETWRIKRAKGIVDNINHKVSSGLAIIGMMVATFISYSMPWITLWITILHVIIWWSGFGFIRLALYDIFLNIFRREKIDYESPTTSSYVDQHTNKLSFWQKRTIGVAGWSICVIVYYIIFKK